MSTPTANWISLPADSRTIVFTATRGLEMATAPSAIGLPKSRATFRNGGFEPDPCKPREHRLVAMTTRERAGRMEPWGFEPQILPCHGSVIPFHYGPANE